MPKPKSSANKPSPKGEKPGEGGKRQANEANKTDPPTGAAKAASNGGGASKAKAAAKQGPQHQGAGKPKPTQPERLVPSEKASMSKAAAMAGQVMQLAGDKAGLGFNDLESTHLEWRKFNTGTTPGALKSMYGSQTRAPMSAIKARYRITDVTRVNPAEGKPATHWVVHTGTVLKAPIVAPTANARLVGTSTEGETFRVLWDTTLDQQGHRVGTSAMPLTDFARFSVANTMLAMAKIVDGSVRESTVFMALEESPLLTVTHFSNGHWEHLRYVISLLYPGPNAQVHEPDDEATLAVPPAGARRAGHRLSRPMMLAVAWWCAAAERQGLGPRQEAAAPASAAATPAAAAVSSRDLLG